MGISNNSLTVSPGVIDGAKTWTTTQTEKMFVYEFYEYYWGNIRPEKVGVFRYTKELSKEHVEEIARKHFNLPRPHHSTWFYEEHVEITQRDITMSTKFTC